MIDNTQNAEFPFNFFKSIAINQTICQGNIKQMIEMSTNTFVKTLLNA